MFKRYILPAIVVSGSVCFSILGYWGYNYLGLKKIKGYNAEEEDIALASQEESFWNENAKLQYRIIDLDGYAL